MQVPNDDAADRAHLWDLIKNIKFAMFTTRHRDGHLHSRPMTTLNRKIDEDASLWFFMSRSGDPVRDLAAEPSVNISYSDPDDDSYVSISGDARVVEDRAKTHALWSKVAEAWFPAGVDDPDLALVQVRIAHADFWDVGESKLTQLFKFVTGRGAADGGEHVEVRM